MEEKKIYFKNCTQKLLEETFSLKQVPKNKILQDWVATETELTDFERKTLEYLQDLAETKIKALKSNATDHTAAFIEKE